MRKRLLIVLAALAVPAALLLAGEAEGASHYEAIAGRSSDFFPRLFNFIIFAGLVYYLVAEPIRSFFKNRKEKIAEQLSEIERRLQEAKEAKKAAQKSLQESEKRAQEIIEDGKKEAKILAKRYKELGEKELATLEAQYKERMETEERRMIREGIVSLLDENIALEDIPLRASQVVDTLAKKVA